jgi:ribosomal protein S27AE
MASTVLSSGIIQWVEHSQLSKMEQGTGASEREAGDTTNNDNNVDGSGGTMTLTVEDIYLTAAVTEETTASTAGAGALASPLGPRQPDYSTNAADEENQLLVQPTKKVVRSVSLDSGVLSPSRPVPMKRCESEPPINCEKDNPIEQHVSPLKRRSERSSPILEIRRLFNRLPFAPSLSSQKLSEETFFCNICLENCSSTLSFTLGSCGMQHKYCRDCLQGYYTAQVNDGAVEHYCPGVYGGCKGQLAHEELASLVSADVMDRQERLVQVKKNPLYRECPACSVGLTLPDQTPRILCGNCGEEYCFFHSNAHVGLTCESYVRSQSRKTRYELRATDQLVNRTTRSCPYCGSATEKNGGCNHMYVPDYIFELSQLTSLVNAGRARIVEENGAGSATERLLMESRGIITTEIYLAVRVHSMRRPVELTAVGSRLFSAAAITASV